MFTRLFADVSSNDGPLNLQTYANAGHVLLMNKATEGESYVNPLYDDQTRLCHQLRVAVAHYHFARWAVTPGPATEARHFLDVIRPNLRPHDYVVLDAENDENNNPPPPIKWINAFCQFVRVATKKPCIVYANRSALHDYANQGTIVSGLVHDADYSTTPNYSPPGTECWARQFTDGVYGPEPHWLPGIGHCDVNTLRLRSFGWLVANRMRLGR
jgi:lysozyme